MYIDPSGILGPRRPWSVCEGHLGVDAKCGVGSKSWVGPGSLHFEQAPPVLLRAPHGAAGSVRGRGGRSGGHWQAWGPLVPLGMLLGHLPNAGPTGAALRLQIAFPFL